MEQSPYAELAAELIDVTDEQLTARLRSLELERRRIEATMAAVTREGERRSIAAKDGHRTIKGWLRAQLNCSGALAARWQRNGRAYDSTPGLGETLLAGHIGTCQADELARVRRNPRCGELLPRSADLLLDHAEHLSFDEFRTVLRRWEAIADLDGAQRSDDVSHEARSASMRVMPGAAGSGLDLRAGGGRGLVAAELQAIFDAFVEQEFRRDVAERTAEHGADAAASKLPRNDRQRRFDALVRIFRRARERGAGGSDPAPIEPTLNLLVDHLTFETLMAKHHLCPPPVDLPALDVYRRRLETTEGAILAPDDVVTAALGGLIRRVVIDSASVPIDAGRARRLFTGVAREIVKMLREKCTHDGCTVSSKHCQVDHVQEWHRDGGATDVGNAEPECGTHNPWKSRHGLRSRRDVIGRIVNERADGGLMLAVGRRPPIVADAIPIYHVRYCDFRRRPRAGTATDDAEPAD